MFSMCGNHIKRVKIVINHNIIEQVTDLKSLGYCTSGYKSDLEDKLQTYIKINGAILRHFGKQTNKETKLRIHNITAKEEVKFGSEAWVLRKERNYV
jgi:ATP-dependent protease ClpP protease subunit